MRLEGRTPVILIEIPGDVDDTVLLYGHLDKQPEMTGWAEGLGPWVPVLKDGKLYGRGGADDGYAMFGALSAILALQAQGVRHARCVILIEACEESGSYDLPAYVDHLAARIGAPSLVVCLDSGCANYEQLWLTTSLRGMAGGALTVQVLTEGVHSGDASGIVPSSFRILRSLLSRLEDEASGEIRLPELSVQSPARPHRAGQGRRRGAGRCGLVQVPVRRRRAPDGRRPGRADPEPHLAPDAIDHRPGGRAADQGRRQRAAPRHRRQALDPAAADARRRRGRRERQTHAGSRPALRRARHLRAGASRPTAGTRQPLAPWLRASIDRASQAAFGRPAALMGEGGSIPFMGMLGEKFPAAQFMITGVLGPHSNAHGPNEFLHIGMGKGVTLAVAQVLADHAGAA